jgi:hypothetical protein
MIKFFLDEQAKVVKRQEQLKYEAMQKSQIPVLIAKDDIPEAKQ